MALWLLGLGVLGAAAAVASGLYGAEGVMVAPSVREHLLVNHERIMLAVLGLSVVLWVWALIARPMPLKGGVVFLILLAILSPACRWALISACGWFTITTPAATHARSPSSLVSDG